MNDKRMAYAAMVVAMMGAAFSAPLNKLGLTNGMQPLAINMWRLGATLILIAPMTLLRAEGRAAVRNVSAKDARTMICAGSALAAHFILWVYALKYTTAFAATALWATYALMSVAIAAIFLKEKTGSAATVGLVLAVIGVGIASYGASGGQLIGNLCALGCALMQAIYHICGRSARKRVNTGTYTLGVYGVCFAWMVLGVLITRTPPIVPGFMPFIVGFGLALTATLCGHSMQNYALKTLRAPTVSALTLSETITGPLVVYFMFGEVPGTNALIGGAIIIVGVGIYLYLAEILHARRVVN